MNQKLLTLGLAALAALSWSACGGDGGGSDSGLDVKAENGKFDVPVVLPDLRDAEVAGEIVDIREGEDVNCAGCDLQPETDSGEVQQDPCIEFPGLPGCPCKENKTCDSGFCIETLEGKECAEFCTETCPTGYSCEPVPGPEAIYICIFRYSRLCTPCLTNEDCREEAAPDNTSVCIVHDPDGRFCGSPCDVDQDCPEGFQCDMVTSVAGSQVKQCEPASGECPCSDKSIADAKSTVCFNENEFGSCSGERHCQEGGLTDCSADEPQKETCDLLDDDCNGLTDDAESVLCTITNSWGSCPGLSGCKDGKEVCNGTAPSEEVCNQADDDCDGETDEQDAADCTIWFKDVDYDGFGLTGDSRCMCGPEAPYTATKGGDCDDGNENIHEGVEEVCNLLDDDCDGETDEQDAKGCSLFYLDNDRDDYGLTIDSKCLCHGTGFYTAVKNNDCDDGDELIHPDAPEICNTRDDNCDGVTDPEDTEGCANYYVDGDGDNYGKSNGQVRCLCAPDPPTKYTALTAGDCNDVEASINPKATEICDQIDNNCNDLTDEPGATGCLIRFKDEDKDQFGTDETLCACVVASPFTALEGGDCDDADPLTNPDAVEVCGDDKDNNCNGLTDEEGAPECVDFYYDFDGDGWGTDLKKCLCKADGFFRAAMKTGDCQDDNADVNPGVQEVCANGQDDNCNGLTDEAGAVGCTWYYYDYDLDGYGSTLKKCLCEPAGLYSSLQSGDCDDSDDTVNPGMDEICNNGKDDNCANGQDEEGALQCTVYFYDGDYDGYGNDSLATRCLCGPDLLTKHTAEQGGDCNDGDPQVNPGRTETCDQKDNDCNGATDEAGAEGCQDYFYDGDGDQHGVDPPTPQCLCGPDAQTKYTTKLSDDCDDNDAEIAPGLLEVCDLKDNDCNGVTDDDNAQDCINYYYDWDSDDYGTDLKKCMCAPEPLTWYTALETGDCNDQDSTVHPGASVCGLDGDCDGDPLDPGEECDDGNGLLWDGCSGCAISEIRINKTAANDQQDASIAAMAGGGYVAAYSVSFSSPATRGSDVAFRLLSSNGIPSDNPSETFINTYTTNDQTNPQAAEYGNGKMAFIFQSFQASAYDTDGWGIYGRSYTLDLDNGGANPGFVTDQDFIVNTYTTSWQRNPRVAAL
ncbi:MAG: hypothetical protein GXP54_01570, partial [Deltaproteobacteria bacterium]|nr:hypothetical protein [Deltaproteobacteria bacterium]